MKNTPNDGGPAFPLPTIDLQTHEIKYPAHDVQGMTLRDYFAAKALSAMVSHPRHDQDTRQFPEYTKQISVAAYRYANAMLAARKES